jgi:hypothetical protein
MAVDQIKRRIGRLQRQIVRTNETQATRKEELAKLKARANKK